MFSMTTIPKGIKSTFMINCEQRVIDVFVKLLFNLQIKIVPVSKATTWIQIIHDTLFIFQL